MIAIIFEVWPAEGRRQDYMDLAGGLRGELAGIDGFISVERFESLTEPGKLLSISFWRDEDAVARWRALEGHRLAQAEGRRPTAAPCTAENADQMRDAGGERPVVAPPAAALSRATSRPSPWQPMRRSAARSRRSPRPSRFAPQAEAAR
jgi:heme-degrading monooxygenase HmoA